MRASRRGPSSALPRVEALLLGAVGRRLAAEPRRRFRAQLHQVGQVQRPRRLPQVSLYSVGRGRGEWSDEVLFPRRDEFVLAHVNLRVDGRVHRWEVVAVNGRLFALLARPPLPRHPERVEVEAVLLGADPMDAGASAA